MSVTLHSAVIGAAMLFFAAMGFANGDGLVAVSYVDQRIALAFERLEDRPPRTVRAFETLENQPSRTAQASEHKEDRSSRIERAFEHLEDRSSASISVAAFQKMRGRRFAATACLTQSAPRLGCEMMGSREPLRVTSVDVIPFIGEGKNSHAVNALVSGRWASEDYVLQIDGDRLQASTDLGLPFEWKRYVLRGIVSGDLVFTIGTELFRAKVWPDEIIVTSTSFRGERALRRVDNMARM